MAGRPEDIADLAQLAAAYSWNSPATAWLIPERGVRPAVLLAWYTLIVEQAVRHGHADLSSDRRTAAIWLDHTKPVPALPDYLRRLTSSCGRYAVGLLQYDRILERHRPRTGHVRLVLLAADTRSASQLLAHRHRRLDEAIIPAYAVAGDAEQGKVLTAAGYQPTSACRLGVGGPKLTMMWRLPGAARMASDVIASAGRAS